MFLILFYKYVVYSLFCAQTTTKQLKMPTENTSLKNITPAGDCNSTAGTVVGKSNTYQRPFLIVANSLLVVLVLIAVAGKSGGQHLKSSAYEFAEGTSALTDYHVDSTNLATIDNIFGFGAVSENDEGNCRNCFMCVCGGICVDF